MGGRASNLVTRAREMSAGEFVRRAPGAAARLLTRLLTQNRFARTVRASRAVTSPVAFVRSGLLGHEGGEHSWRLRASGLEVSLRTGTRDRDIFEEIFVEGVYDWPPEVAKILDDRRPLNVLDLGANVGLFGTRIFSLRPDASVTGFEPDPTNLSVLDPIVERSPHRDSWKIVRACAAPAAGTIRFLTGRFADSRAVFGPDAGAEYEELEAVDVFPYFEGVDLLKIDIEGGEWPILTDPRFDDVTIPAIVLEHHGYDCPGPGNCAETATRLLEQRGYTVIETDWDPIGCGTVWAWRSQPA